MRLLRGVVGRKQHAQHLPLRARARFARILGARRKARVLLRDAGCSSAARQARVCGDAKAPRRGVPAPARRSRSGPLRGRGLAAPQPQPPPPACAAASASRRTPRRSRWRPPGAPLQPQSAARPPRRSCGALQGASAAAAAAVGRSCTAAAEAARQQPRAAAAAACGAATQLRRERAQRGARVTSSSLGDACACHVWWRC